jgi:toxin-antitoxin system PIN domain toxin
MIVPDVNLLLYAFNDGSPRYDSAKRWWEDLVNGAERVGIPWIVSVGFVRLMTHPKMLARPVTPEEAVDYVREWFQFPHITPINPGADPLAHLRRNLTAAGVGGNLVTDAHIAALAMEYQAEVHSNDTDFSRFPGLRWRNPL